MTLQAMPHLPPWLLAHDLLCDVFVPNWNINYNLSIATDCSDNTKPKITEPLHAADIQLYYLSIFQITCFEY